MINMHVLIPLQKKKVHAKKQEVWLNRKSYYRKWMYRRCTECYFITHKYCSLFPFRCACVRACVRASVRACVWICRHAVISKQGEEKCANVDTIPHRRFTGGSRSTHTFREQNSSKCTRLESSLNMLTDVGTSAPPPPLLRSPSTDHDTRDEGTCHSKYLIATFKTIDVHEHILVLALSRPIYLTGACANGLWGHVMLPQA